MEKAISSDIIRGHIDTIILYSLLDGDKHAQQISEYIESKSENKYSINQATLYSSLKRLENLKQVSAYMHDIDNGRRRFFKILDAGKKVIEENLSSWSYSREIIDKLIDFEPSPIVRTEIVPQVVERIVYKPMPISQQETQVQNVDRETHIVTENISEKPVESTEKPLINTVQTQTEPEQELNFRNILNGLIKIDEPENVVENPTNDTPKPLKPVAKPQKPTESQDNKPEVFSLDETLNRTTDHNNITSPNLNGRIDYNDLAVKAEYEGYKIRFSSKESKKIKGNIFINKVDLCSSLAVFLLLMIEFFLVVYFGQNLIKIPNDILLISMCVCAIFPIIKVICYLSKPQTLSKTVAKDTILTALIVIFNLIVITFALNVFLDVKFDDTQSLFLYFILPCVIYFDIFVYYLARYLFSISKRFQIKKQH